MAAAGAGPGLAPGPAGRAWRGRQWFFSASLMTTSTVAGSQRRALEDEREPAGSTTTARPSSALTSGLPSSSRGHVGRVVALRVGGAEHDGRLRCVDLREDVAAVSAHEGAGHSFYEQRRVARLLEVAFASGALPVSRRHDALCLRGWGRAGAGSLHDAHDRTGDGKSGATQRTQILTLSRRIRACSAGRRFASTVYFARQSGFFAVTMASGGASSVSARYSPRRGQTTGDAEADAGGAALSVTAGGSGAP